MPYQRPPTQTTAPKDYTNKGNLKPNLKKSGETSPDFKGLLNVEGKTYFVSGWNTRFEGKINLSIQEAPERDENPY